jgi:hypothetical protein
LNNHERIYDQVDDVRHLLDGLGNAIQDKSHKIQTNPSSTLHQTDYGRLRNISRSNQNLSAVPASRGSYSGQPAESCFIVGGNDKGSYGEANFRVSDEGLTTEDEIGANNEYRSLAHFTPAPHGEWSKEKTIPTSVPLRERSRQLSSSTICSVHENSEFTSDSEKFKPLLDLVDLYYTGQKSLSKSPAFLQKFNRILSEMRPGQDDIKNQLIDREIELRASSNSEKEKLKKELENTNLENKRLRHEISTLSNTSITSSNDEVVSMLRDSHELIKSNNAQIIEQNERLEKENRILKKKYEEDMKQMKQSHAQLKALLLKNSF